MHSSRIVLAALLALRCGAAGGDAPSCERGALGFEAQVKRGGGAVIGELLPGGPAQSAGLAEGDVLVRIGDRDIPFACDAEVLAFNRDCAPVTVVVERDGTRIEKSIQPAEQSALYQRACEAGNAMACFRVAYLGDGNYAHACEEQGSPEACASYGHALTTEKSQDAVRVLDKGCNRGSGTACAHLAFLYAEGTMVPRDHIRALDLYTRSCSLGDARGCYNVGVNYDHGRGISVNHTRAAAAYEEACNAGVSMACTNLGFLYERGRGVTADKPRAAELFRRGCEGSPCEASNLRGCVNLGNVYREGIGVPQDYARAAEIFKAACARNDSDEADARRRACVLFAALQFSGLGVPKNEAEAFRVSKAGCDEGDAFGCFNVGIVHANRENYSLAAAFYDRACEGGDAEGCYELGRLYDDAKGVAFDPDRAATLYRRACHDGFAAACER